MMWRAAILYAMRQKNLIVRQGEEKHPAELIRGMQPELSISKFSIFGCLNFMSKRDGDVSKFEALALEGNLWVALIETKYTCLRTQYTHGGRSSRCYHQRDRSGLIH